ncbi:hypothetical protein DOY81_009596 [Sarcophaga bullata]|nr:hypothetical protein DOY81_009596 [Sarcophaga bullata]
MSKIFHKNFLSTIGDIVNPGCNLQNVNKNTDEKRQTMSASS